MGALDGAASEPDHLYGLHGLLDRLGGQAIGKPGVDGGIGSVNQGLTIVSGENFAADFRSIGWSDKSGIEALAFIAEVERIESEQVEYGGLQVADFESIFADPIAELVGGTHCDAWLYTTTSHPDREAVDVVITAEEF